MHTIKALAVSGLLVLPALAWSDSFRLYSPTVQAGRSLSEQHVFNNFGCNGKNISPKLVWEGAPKRARSFAVTVYDPDAPTGSGWWHWVVLNIPASIIRLSEGALGARNLVRTFHEYLLVFLNWYIKRSLRQKLAQVRIAALANGRRNMETTWLIQQIATDWAQSLGLDGL